MNELGMVVDVSHASSRTAMDAIEASETPVTVQPRRFLYAIERQFPSAKAAQGRGVAGLRQEGWHRWDNRRSQPFQQ